MSALIAVTGATGHVGRALAERLLEEGVKVRAVGRSAESLASLTKKGAEARVGDVEDVAFMAEVFRGTDGVFAMVPPHLAAPDHRAYQRRVSASLAEALKRAGVTRVVALSSVGADLPSGTGPIAGLHAFEETLKSVPGLALVALRGAFFMENYLSSIPLIKTAGINGGGMRGDVVCPMVATRDIGAVAAGLLKAPAFEGHAVREVLGPRDYTHREATSILGGAIGRPDLPYVDFPDEDFKKGLMGAGFSESMADDFVEMSTAFNEGHIQKTLSRSAASSSPTTMEEFAKEIFAPAFRAG